MLRSMARPIDNSSSRPLAPAPLATLQRFLNTRDADAGIELLEAPADVKRWFLHHELIGDGPRIGRAELEQALAVREALRAALRAKDGVEVPDEAVDALDAAARDARLTLSWGHGGEAVLLPRPGGLAGGLGMLLTIAHRAQLDGTWERLKVCPDASCGWVFWDQSRNRSSTWCSMEVCGNRAKARAFRERRARR